MSAQVEVAARTRREDFLQDVETCKEYVRAAQVPEYNFSPPTTSAAAGSKRKVAAGGSSDGGEGSGGAAATPARDLKF